MNNYGVALPLNLNQLFTYKSPLKLTRGCRVLVSFNNNLLTGFIWNEQPASATEGGYRIKEVIEVIDDSSLLPPDLLALAEWISGYYICGLGIVISAMLPTAIQIQIAQEVKRVGTDLETTALDEREVKLLQLLKENEWSGLSELKEQTKNLPVYKLLESLEDKGFIEIKRTYDAKLKKKFANFIVINQQIEETPKLTSKQNDAWEAIRSNTEVDETGQSSLPLARLADTFSYSIIKALREKRLISIEAREVIEGIDKAKRERIESNLQLSEEQSSTFDRVNEQMIKQEFATFLLYGVTGSGKTEVYIRLIRQALALSRSAVVLVPEISLTPQMEERFYNAFGENIAILHSHRNDRERWEEWKRIKRGDCRIVLGARSAIFAPLENIGIIIVDEEHEGSYKQDKNPRYNARDLAVLRGKQNNSVVLLGSATPSLESWYNVLNDKYQLTKLTHRPLRIPMPEVTIVDMKDESSDNPLLSEVLKTKILERLERKEQIILLQNRRGYASFIICVSCGKIHRCPNCDVSLIYHSNDHILMCHYCGHSEKMIRKCPDCGSYVLEFGTAGTQQLEKQLQILFPNARLLRMDTDTVRSKDSYNTMFKRMREQSVDILFGTQMIAKGLDFSQVTLVGVISADHSLNIPDFRATERTFQLLTQVAGRSGRGEKKGEVIIQTYNPKHYAILRAKAQDFNGFVVEELENRKALSYPPYVRNARLVFVHTDEEFLRTELEKIKPLLQKIREHHRKTEQSKPEEKTENRAIFSLLGPVPTPIHRINNKFRFHLIIKSSNVKNLLNSLDYLLNNHKLSKSIKIEIDVDPSSLL